MVIESLTTSAYPYVSRYAGDALFKDVCATTVAVSYAWRRMPRLHTVIGRMSRMRRAPRSAVDDTVARIGRTDS